MLLARSGTLGLLDSEPLNLEWGRKLDENNAAHQRRPIMGPERQGGQIDSRISAAHLRSTAQAVRREDSLACLNSTDHAFPRRTQFVQGLPFRRIESQPIRDFRHGLQLLPIRRALIVALTETVNSMRDGP